MFSFQSIGITGKIPIDLIVEYNSLRKVPSWATAQTVFVSGSDARGIERGMGPFQLECESFVRSLFGPSCLGVNDLERLRYDIDRRELKISRIPSTRSVMSSQKASSSKINVHVALASIARRMSHRWVGSILINRLVAFLDFWLNKVLETSTSPLKK